MVAPRYGEIATFMRTPYAASAEGVDIALIGIPYDGGTTNRAGARHGPREIRNMSSLMRSIHHVSHCNPYELCRVADLGDVRFTRIFEDEAVVEEIAAFYREVHRHRALPLTAGGDHSITYPIFKAIAADESLGMVHIDAHTDTWDEFQGSKFTHGAPFRRAVEDGLLDPKRTIQIGIRGAQNTSEGWDFSLDQGMRVVFMEEFDDMGVDATIEEARRVVGERPDVHLVRRGRSRPGLCARHRNPGNRRYHDDRRAKAAQGSERPRPSRRRCRGGSAAVRPDGKHRSGRSHHDVRDPLPARGSTGRTRELIRPTASSPPARSAGVGSWRQDQVKTSTAARQGGRQALAQATALLAITVTRWAR